jgi:hypothetical protein
MAGIRVLVGSPPDGLDDVWGCAGVCADADDGGTVEVAELAVNDAKVLVEVAGTPLSSVCMPRADIVAVGIDPLGEGIRPGRPRSVGITEGSSRF